MAIQRTLGLEIGTQETSANFILKVGDENVKITFLEASPNSFLGAQNQAILYKINDKSRAIVYIEGHKAIIMIAKPDAVPTIFSIKIEELQNIEWKFNGGSATVGKNTLYWNIINGKIVSIKDGILTFSAQAIDVKLEFSLENIQPMFGMMSGGYTIPVVPPGNRSPEFSIGVFDNYTVSGHVFTSPRPMRLGVPVISTIPVADVVLSEDQQEYYNNGLGLPYRKMHFRVICTETLDPALPVHLMISLPNGEDTVGLPIAVPLANIDNVNNIYYANYVFNAEDTINYVDGFVYLSVHIPLIQQIALPMMIQLDDNSDSDFSAPSEDVTLFSINQDTVQVIGEKKKKSSRKK